MRKRKISTNNKEIYIKLNLLKFSPEVVLNNVKVGQLSRIINNINKDSINIEMEQVNNKVILKKLKEYNFDIYLKK